MRVLLINYELPPLGGGAGNATANIAREMAAAGHQVSIMTSAFHRLPRREVLEGVFILRVPTLRRRADRCTPFEMMVFMASALIALRSTIRTLRPTVIIAFFGIPCGPIGWIAKRIWGIPYVIALRGGDVPGYQPYDLAHYHRLVAPLIGWLWRGAGAVVANSRGLRELARCSAPGLRIRVIPNGVDADHFRPASSGRKDGRPRLLFVGRLTRQKGLDVLLNALSRIAPHVDFELTLVGDGPERHRLVELACELSLEDRIRFHGWAARPDLPDLYRAADIFVLPSRDEGMPNALLEAMSSGLAAVSSRISGCEELTTDGTTGFLVRAESDEELADAIMTLAKDELLREQFGRAARQRVERDFRWSKVAAAYIDVAERLAQSQGDHANETIDAV